MNVSDPLALLSALVEVPSPSGEEAACADLVVSFCRASGLSVERVGQSLLIRLGCADGPRLLLVSHLDTVPAGDGWDADPHDGAWRSDRLVARGANDAKASVASMLWTARTLRATELEGELLLALTACEETSNAGMTAVLEHLSGTEVDGAVVGEPTGLEVVRAQAGLVVLEADWSGESCHAAHVAYVEHENALVVAAEELSAFGPFRTVGAEHELIGTSTIAPTVFTSGARHNVVPCAARAVFDARLAPPVDAQACVRLLESRLPRAEIRVRSQRLRAVDTPANHPLVRASLEAAGRARAIGSNTLSDMALLAGIPAVKCGPGETQRSHTRNEYVTAGEVRAGVGFYTALVPLALAALSKAVAP